MPPSPPPYLPALLFAIVQGATEFLPVSSSGHLLLLAIITGAGAGGDSGEPFLMTALLHTATALAAVIYYRRPCRQALRGLWQPGPARRFLCRYALSQAATAAIALPLFLILTGAPAAQWQLSLWAIGIAMLLNAIVLLAAPRGDAAAADATDADAILPQPTRRAALWIGLAQGLAVIPGLSRAGLTIAAARHAGLDGDAAAAISFLLAPPVILAAAILWTIQTWPDTAARLSDWQSIAILLAMGALTFLIALAAIHWTASWTRAGRLRWFAPWNAALGIGALIAAAVSAVSN